MKSLFRYRVDLRVGPIVFAVLAFSGCVPSEIDVPEPLRACKDLLTPSAGAPEIVTIGTGTQTGGFPVRTQYQKSRTQVIYLADEIGRAGRITDVEIYVSETPGTDRNEWTLRMKQTSLSSFASATWEGAGWTRVYICDGEPPGTIGWHKYHLAPPFDVDNTSNLMLDFSFSNASSTSGYGLARRTVTDSCRTVALHGNIPGAPTLWSGSVPAAEAYAWIPNIRLTIRTEPVVADIVPAFAAADGTVSISNLAGKFFQAGATVQLCRSGQSPICATDVVVDGSTCITCTFDLTGAAGGRWDVVVTNPDGKTGTFADGFAVLEPPTVIGITPNSSPTNRTVHVTNLAGTGFQPGSGTPVVRLRRSGQPNIDASGVTVVSSTTITCTFDLTAAAIGPWDVAVTNPDNLTGVLADGFTIMAPPPVITTISPNTGITNSVVYPAHVFGTGFQPGAVVKLSRAGQPDIAADSVLVDNATRITCRFSLGTVTGPWNVVVINPDGQTGVGQGLFTVRVPTVLHVDADARGGDNGTSWANAFVSLQDALRTARPGDSIWVAEGIYRPDQGRGMTPGDRAATFQLGVNVGLYGGFAGTESERSQRNWRQHATVLSGDLNGDDGPDFSATAENSLHVVTGADNSTLDGFTVTGGFANGAATLHQYGGGMYSSCVTATVANCTFVRNAAAARGGAVYGESGVLLITNCVFAGNRAPHGGAMYHLNCFDFPISNCVFYQNTTGAESGAGGAVYNNHAGPKFLNCTFFGNSAADGGAILDAGPPGCTIRNSIIWGNAPDGIRADGMSLPAVTYSDVQGTALYPGEGNVCVDPHFVNTADPDLALAFGSPCIDAGDSAAVPAFLTTDLFGNPRLTDDPGSVDTGRGPAPVVDMGAHEYFFDEANCPRIAAVVVQSERTVDVTFSEPMAAPEIMDPAHYTLGGAGRGSLSSCPDTVSAAGEMTYRLAWTDGEMRHGGDVTVTVTEVTDLAGNPIWSPNSGTHVGGGLGTLPAVTAVSPPRGSSVSGFSSVVVTFSEPVIGVAAGCLAVNGSAASRLEGDGAGPYSFTGFAFPSEGPASIVLAAGTIRDAAGNAFLGDQWACTVLAGTPTITVQPCSQFVVPGHPVTFSIAAVGSGPLHYQWQRRMGATGWDNLTDAAAADYTIPSVAAVHAGNYRCLVWNTAGSATSYPASLNGGDADRDGHVGFADFSILQNNYGQSGKTWSDADFTGDGLVTFEDFVVLQNNYGR